MYFSFFSVPPSLASLLLLSIAIKASRPSFTRVVFSLIPVSFDALSINVSSIFNVVLIYSHLIILYALVCIFCMHHVKMENSVPIQTAAVVLKWRCLQYDELFDVVDDLLRVVHDLEDVHVLLGNLLLTEKVCLHPLQETAPVH